MSAPKSTPQVSLSEKDLYTRQSSGLIRSISLSSSVALNITNIGVIFAILVITTVPAGFPKSDPVWMAIITTLVCILPALLYGAWTATIPRSGADYVWNSRVFAPIVGFSASFLAVVWYVLVNGFLAYLLGSDALPTAFYIIGTAFDSQTIIGWGDTVSQTDWTFVIGIVALLLGLLVSALGMRRATRTIVVILILELIGLAVAVIVLLLHSRADFTSAVNHFGTHYEGYVTAANSAGHSRSGYTLSQTLLSMPPLYLGIGYAVASAYAGGELRSARRSGLLGPPIAVVLAGVAIVAAFLAASKTMGFDFIGSAAYLDGAGSKAYTLPVGANFFGFVSLLTSSPVAAIPMAIAYVLAPLASILVVTLYCTRAVFAWSFDRILPDRLASVSARTAVPVPALVFVFLVGFAYLLAIRIFGTTTLETLGATVAGSSIAFMFAALGAVLLPFLKRTRPIYELSPIRGKFLGVPTLSIVGGVSFVIYAFMFVAALTQDAIGANTTKALLAQAVVLVIALGIFPVSYYLNRRRGVDLRLLGKELPPE